MYVRVTMPTGTKRMGECLDKVVSKVVEKWGNAVVSDCRIRYTRGEGINPVVVEPVSEIGIDVGDNADWVVTGWFDREVIVHAESTWGVVCTYRVG